MLGSIRCNGKRCESLYGRDVNGGRVPVHACCRGIFTVPAANAALRPSSALDPRPLLPQPAEVVLHVHGVGELVHVVVGVPGEVTGSHALPDLTDVAVQLTDVGIHDAPRQAPPLCRALGHWVAAGKHEEGRDVV